jgi:tetratricopeptide (TPR) repeat protein
MAVSGRRRIVRAVVVLAVLFAIVAGGYGLHKYRKRTTIRHALAAGTSAYQARKWSDAADQLGRYLAAVPRDLDVLLTYADAQTQRRPRSRASVGQATRALETALRIKRGDPKASQMLVQLYQSINAPIEAERVARAWNEAHPDDVQARQSLAAALIVQQKLDEAVEVLEEVVAAHPECQDAAGALAFLRVSHKKQPVQEGLKLLDAAVAANSNSAAARLARARFLMAAGQYAKAREDLEAAEKMEPAALGVMLDLAGLLADMGFYDRASAEFDRAQSAFPDNTNVYLLPGRVALDFGDTAGAAQIADRALAAPLGEQRLDVLPLAAELYAAAGRPEAARRCIEQIKATDTPSEMILYLEGLTLLAEGKPAESASALQDAIRRAPKFSRAFLALGRAQTQAGDLRQAAYSFAEAVRLAGGSMLQAQVELARVYAALGRGRDAARVAKDAERQAPLNGQVLLTSMEVQGLAARPGGDSPDPAVIQRLAERAGQLASRAPDDIRLQILLARLDAWQGRTEEAAALLRASYRDPANKPAASAALAQVYAEAGRYEEAIAECKVAIDASNEQQRPANQVRLAELYLAAGQADKAIELSDQIAARANGPSGSAVLLNMAQALLRSNQQDMTRQLLQKVLAQDGRNIPARLILLGMQPAKDAKPDRQELVDQLKQIEGDAGLNWRIWQARLWLEREDWAANRARIEALLNECLLKAPNSDEVASVLASLYKRTGQADQALAMYERAFEANPSDVQLAWRLLDAAIQTQQWEKVDRVLSSLSADEPSLQPYYVDLALRKGDLARAQDLLRARVKAGPADYRSRLQLATLRRMQNDTVGAQKWLDEAVAVAPDAVDVLAARVEFCLSCSDPDRALALCNESLARAVRPEVLALRAAVWEHKGDLAEARKDLVTAAQADGWAERGCLALGQLYAGHGQPQEALQTYRKGLQAVPGSVLIRRATVSVLLAGDEQQTVEGLALLEELLKDMPTDEGLMTLKAEFKERTNPSEAEAIYEEVVKQHPASARACEKVARHAVGRGHRDRAVTLVERALSSNPRNMDLLLLKAELLSADNPGRAALAAADAQALARQVLALQPYNEQAAVLLARARIITGDTAGAMAELQSFLSRKDVGGSLTPRLLLAGLYLAAKDSSRAEDMIRQCSSLAPEDPRTAELRIACYALQKEWESILPFAEAFTQKHPDDLAVTMAAAQQLMMAPQDHHQKAAVSLLESAARRAPADPDVLGRLGLACYRIGRVEDAKSAFQRALHARPGQVGLANGLAWILCEHDRNPQEARKVIGDAAKVDTGTSDFASLLDTLGVVEYRLGAAGPADQHLAESRTYLEACLRHPRAEASTKASATFHLARTLAELDKSRSQQLLEGLFANPARQELLSAEDREEARKLLKQLGGQSAGADLSVPG